MYVHIFGYLVNKLEIWWVYLSPIGSTDLNITEFLQKILLFPEDCTSSGLSLDSSDKKQIIK